MLINKRYFLLGTVSLLASCSSYIHDKTFVPTKGAVKPLDWVSAQPQIISSTSVDGNSIESWFFAPSNENSLTLAVFHGNSDHVGAVSKWLEPLLELGCGLFVLDYRGYANNSGTPTESGLIDDAFVQLDALEKLGVLPSKTVLFGHSLGGALAVIVARKLQSSNKLYRALLTIGAVPSIADLAPAFASSFIKDKFDAVTAVRDLRGMKVFVQGREDSVVPPSIARKLIEAAAIPPIAAILLHGEGHRINMANNLTVFKTIINSIELGNLGLIKDLSSQKIKVNVDLG